MTQPVLVAVGAGAIGLGAFNMATGGLNLAQFGDSQIFPNTALPLSWFDLLLIAVGLVLVLWGLAA